MTAKKNIPAPLSQEDEAQIQQILARRQALAEKLHNCTSRIQAEALFAAVFSLSEAAQMGLLKSLVHVSDADSADLLLALHELAPDKLVRKEARRALIQLAGAKVVPSWTPEEDAPAVGSAPAEPGPRFWKGLVAEMRDSGELQLILCWELGFEYGEARMVSFLLDFWAEGVKDFLTETGTKRQIEERMRELQRATREEANPEEAPAVYVDCTLAEGRRLLNEALDINRWRKTEPHKDFRQHLPLVQRLILHASEVGEDRGRTFISRGEEPDMIAANFAGAWSMGDYGLCYDLLTSSSPLLEGHAREEWIELRRNWADEAHPARFEIYFLREREQAKQSTLWLPNSVMNTRSAASHKEIELSWSLALAETPLSGTLLEMPMGTAVYKETGRYWFWTVYSLEQEKGEWRIARIKDEGAAVQALPTEELRKLIQEHDDAAQKIMREHQPDEPDANQFYEEIIWRTWKILSLYDALLVKDPLDKAIYEDGYGRAMSIRAVERSAVYAAEIVKRFPNDPDHIIAQQRLAAVEVAVGERLASMGITDLAGHFMDLGETELRSALSEQEPLGYLLLAELLMSKNELDEGEKQLLIARELMQDPEQKASVEFNLANLAINRERFPEAQGYLERLAEIAPNYPSVWYALGLVHRNQQHIAEAEQYYRRALEVDPTDVRAYSEMAALFADGNDLDKARDILAQGIRVLPTSAHLRALMAMVYIDKKDRRRAQEYLNEAERLNPELEVVQAVRELVKKI